MTVRRNKPDDLTKKYLEMEERILLDLEQRKYKNIPELKKDLRDRIADAMKTLETVNSEFVEKELGTIYRERAEKQPSGDFRRLRDNIFIDLKTGLQGAVKGLNKRVSNILKAQSEQEIATVFSATNAIREELTKSGVFKVTYSDGKQIPLASYAFMAARSARTETANTANLDAAKRNGSDLVKCTTIYPTCEICSQFQGRVYSISGKDKRFPALYETALKNGYQLMHPNCRHEFLPYFEELRTEEEIEKDRAFSNRPFNLDYRGKKERDAYTDWQVFNRQVREERSEFNELKDYFGGSFPYKTIGGFRRGRRANSSEYRQFKDQYRRAHRQNYPARIGNSGGDLTGKSRRDRISIFPGHTPAKTIDEAESFAKRFAENVNYGATDDVAAVDAVNQTLERLAMKYPLEKLEGITFARMEKQGTMAAYVFPKKLTLNKNFIENSERYRVACTTGWKEGVNRTAETLKTFLKQKAGTVKQREKWARELAQLETKMSYTRNNVLYEGREIESVITHEMGHIIPDQIFGLCYRSDSKLNYYETLTNPYFEKVLKVKAAFNLAKRSGDIKNISYYALTDEKEFFAECFTVYELQEENLPEYIRRMVEEVLRV